MIRIVITNISNLHDLIRWMNAIENFLDGAKSPEATVILTTGTKAEAEAATK